MPDLQSLFRQLEAAARNGRFEAELMRTPLADAGLYGHPLGFRVAKISHGDTALRLHLWSGISTEQPGFEVHDHMFDLTSHVVQGTIVQRGYDFVEDLNGPQALYDVTYDEGKSVIAKTDKRGRLVLKGAERFNVGTTYELSAGQLHFAERTDSAFAITLALTRTRLCCATTVGPQDGDFQLQASRLRLDYRPLCELGLEAALRI